MESRFQIRSEIGPLKTVLLHRPGEELLNLSPSNLERLLFDDIPYLEVAQAEHDVFARMLAEEGVHVLYLEDLVADALRASEDARGSFIEAYIEGSGVRGRVLAEAIGSYLLGLAREEDVVRKAIAGIRSDDIDAGGLDNATLSDLTSLAGSAGEHLIVDPIPNLYFTRDTFSVIGSGVSLNSMTKPARRREALFAQTIFAYHPDYLEPHLWYTPSEGPRIEGGDILVLSPTTVAIGVSERTEAAAIDAIAKRLLWAEQDERFDRVMAFSIPETRAFMHLDTVFTQVDVDTFTVHPNILSMMEVYELTRGREAGEVRVRHLDGALERTMAEALGLPSVRLIKCGGEDPIAAAREQWNDGSNTLAVRPGRVYVYQRNSVTNDILYAAGLELLEIPSAELSRGRGGPHCMSMAFIRDEIA